METHLRPLHLEIFNELILLEQEVQSQRDLLSDQRKLNEKKAEKYPSQSQIQLQWDINILQLLVETELPFTLVEHPGFRKFMNKVDLKVLLGLGVETTLGPIECQIKSKFTASFFKNALIEGKTAANSQRNSTSFLGLLQ